MRHKLALLATLLAFQVIYLEWSGGHSAFVYEVHWQVFFGSADKADSFAHPLVLLPFLGEVILLLAVFLPKMPPRLVYAGLVALGVLAGLVLVVGLLSRSPRIALSTLPFFAAAGWCWQQVRWRA